MRPGYGQLLFYATLLVVMIFNALMTGLTICHVLRKYPVSLRPNSILPAKFKRLQDSKTQKRCGARSPFRSPSFAKAFHLSQAAVVVLSAEREPAYHGAVVHQGLRLRRGLLRRAHLLAAQPR